MRLRPTGTARGTGLEWLTLDEVKRFLRITWDSEDELLSSLLESSAGHCRAVLNRPILPEVWTYTFGPASVAPTVLVVPHVEPGSDVSSVNVSVGGATAVAQAYKSEPFYDVDLGELELELEDVPSIDDGSRAVWEVLVSMPRSLGLEQRVRDARLLVIQGMHEGNLDQALDAAEMILRPYARLAA